MKRVRQNGSAVQQTSLIAVVSVLAVFASPSFAAGSSPREDGARYGQAIGATLMCYKLETTDEFTALKTRYSGSELNVFSAEAEKKRSLPPGAPSRHAERPADPIPAGSPKCGAARKRYAKSARTVLPCRVWCGSKTEPQFSDATALYLRVYRPDSPRSLCGPYVAGRISQSRLDSGRPMFRASDTRSIPCLILFTSCSALAASA